MSEAIEYGKGIHILRQDPTEAIFSFIISQNNHIPRIKGIIERICGTLGEDMGEYHAFPSVENLQAQARISTQLSAQGIERHIWTELQNRCLMRI